MGKRQHKSLTAKSKAQQRKTEIWLERASENRFVGASESEDVVLIIQILVETLTFLIADHSVLVDF